MLATSLSSSVSISLALHLKKEVETEEDQEDLIQDRFGKSVRDLAQETKIASRVSQNQ